MKIQQVVRYKGTILIGKLDFDVKPNDNLQIVTGKEIISCRVFSIINDNVDNLVDQAFSGENVAMMFCNISNKEINVGDELRSIGKSKS